MPTRRFPLKAAADEIGRSPQWLRDKIRSGEVLAHVQQAGTRTRFYVDEAEVDRLRTELAPQPFDAGRSSSEALPAAAARADPLTVDDMVLDGLVRTVEGLRARVSELERDLARAEEQGERYRRMALAALGEEARPTSSVDRAER